MRYKSCSCTAWITTPAARKRSALKKACVMKWNMAADHAPRPSARNIYPIWLIVEYARTRFISRCARALKAASSIVAVPMMATAELELEGRG